MSATEYMSHFQKQTHCTKCMKQKKVVPAIGVACLLRYDAYDRAHSSREGVCQKHHDLYQKNGPGKNRSLEDLYTFQELREDQLGFRKDSDSD